MGVRDIVAILIVLLSVWGGISKAIDRAAKKRRQQEMLKQQRTLQTSGEGEATQRGTVPVTLRTGRPIEQPAAADDLAARRRAQLEELRQRRMGRRGAAVPPTMPQPVALQRPGPISGQFPGQFPSRGQLPRSQQQVPVLRPTPPPAQPKQGTQQEIRQIEANAAGWRRRQEFEARRRRDEQARRQGQEKAAAEQEAVEAARTQSARAKRPTPQTARRSAIREIVDAEPGAADPRSIALAAAGLSLSSLADSLRSPEQVRRAILLKEILDPPVSIRGL